MCHITWTCSALFASVKPALFSPGIWIQMLWVQRLWVYLQRRLHCRLHCSLEMVSRLLSCLSWMPEADSPRPPMARCRPICTSVPTPRIPAARTTKNLWGSCLQMGFTSAFWRWWSVEKWWHWGERPGFRLERKEVTGVNVEEEEEKQAPKSLPSTGRHEYHQNLKSQVADVARGCPIHQACCRRAQRVLGLWSRWWWWWLLGAVASPELVLERQRLLLGAGAERAAGLIAAFPPMEMTLLRRRSALSVWQTGSEMLHFHLASGTGERSLSTEGKAL